MLMKHFEQCHLSIFSLAIQPATMLASPRPFVPTAQPSNTVIKAAQTAAGSQHAQINLIRLIKSLEKLDPSIEPSLVNTRRKDWEVSTCQTGYDMRMELTCNLRRSSTLECFWILCPDRRRVRQTPRPSYRSSTGL